MVRVAEQAASPALLAALQVYWPACSEKASTMMSMAQFVISSKWNTTFLVGTTGCRLWNQLISGFGRPDTHAWKRATSPCGTVQLVSGWMKTGFWPMEGFFTLVRLVGICHWDSAGLSAVCFCPETKHVHWLCMLYLIDIQPSQHNFADFQLESILCSGNTTHYNVSHCDVINNYCYFLPSLLRRSVGQWFKASDFKMETNSVCSLQTNVCNLLQSQ